MALVDVNPDPGISELKLVHGTGANQGWVLRQETGGLMIDLGAVYVLDAMQIWNFNRNGLEVYGTDSFDLYVSTQPTPPVDNSQMTRVVANQAIPRAALGDMAYQGETFLLGGAPGTVIPATWGDESGAVTNIPGTVRARYLLLGNLRGQSGAGHVGLSEIKLVGRLEAASQTFTGGLAELISLVNGTVFRPPVDFNSGDPDNDEDSLIAPVPGFKLNPGKITVALNDLGNTNRDGNPPGEAKSDAQAFEVIVRPIQDTPTIPFLAPVQVADEDTSLTLAPTRVFDPDVRSTLNLAGATVFDPDWRGSLELAVQHGTISLPQTAGPSQIVAAAGAKGTSASGNVDVAAENAFRSAANAINRSRLNTAELPWVHSNLESVPNPGNWSLARETGGLMIDLGAVYAIDALQIWNFNLQGNDASGNPLTNYGPTGFDLYVSSTGNNWPTGAAAMTLVAAGVELNRAPGTAGYVGETYLFGDEPSARPEWGDHDGAATPITDTGITARYLFLGNLQGTNSAGGHVGLSEVQVAGRLVGTPNLVFREGDGVDDRRVRFEGPLDDLNAMLAGITYTGDRDYNSGMPSDPSVVTDPAAANFDAAALAAAAGIVPDVLSIRLDDLGLTGANPAGVPSWVVAGVPIVVLPIQDESQVDVTGVTSTQVNEDTDLRLQGVVLADPDADYDPNWRGTVTVTARHGVLRMPMGNVGTVPISVAPNRLVATNWDGGRVPQPFNLTGHGVNKAVDGAIGVDMALVDVNPNPAVIDEKLVHRRGENQGWVVWQERGGLLIDLGDVYALDGMQIWNFNEAGLEAYGPQSFDLYVSAVNSDVLPVDRSEMTLVRSGQPLPRAVPGDATYQGESFLFGGATQNLLPAEWGDEDGMVPSLAPAGVRARYLLLGNLSGQPGAGHVGLSEIRLVGRREDPEQTYSGTLSELTALVNSTIYRGLPDYNSGNPAYGIAPDVVTVTLSDLGNTNRAGGPPPAIRTDSQDFEVIVHPKQDRPTISLPSGAQVVNEGASLNVEPIRAFDVDARSSLEVDGDTLIYDPGWVGSIELEVQYGTLSLLQAQDAEPISAVAARGTNEAGTADVAAENIFRGAVNAIDGSRLNTAVTPWVHSNLESVLNPSSWSLAQQAGGLMIDLGAVYVIDALQIWNFNLQGNDPQGNPLTAYGTTRFDLYASTTGNSWPAGQTGMTLVSAGVDLNRAPGTAGYLGETYVFGENPSAPPVWGDQDGILTEVTDTLVTARYLFLGNLQGTASAGGHVGLSEVRVFGRLVGTPNLVFREGDGLDDRRLRIEGPLDDLNAVLDAIVYRPDANFNSGTPTDPDVITNPGHPEFDPSVLAAAAGVVPDVLRIRVGDLGNTDIAGVMPELSAFADLPILVFPAQDAPLVDLTQLGPVTVDPITSVPSVSVTAIEDMPQLMPPILVFDVDAQPTYDPAGPLSQYDPTVPGWNGYDPAWRGRVTIEAANGSLSLATEFVPQELTDRWTVLDDSAINGTLFADPTASLPPVGGEGSNRDEAGLMGLVNPATGTSVSGLVTTAGRQWAHTTGINDATKWLVQSPSGRAGLLISLPGEYTIDVLQLWNFNASGLEQYGIDQFQLYTAPTGAMPANLAGWTQVLPAGLAVPKAPGGAGYLGQTFVFGGADPARVIPAALGDADGPTLRAEEVTGQYLFLQLQNAAAYVGLSELKIFGRPAGAADLTFIEGDGVEDKRLVIEGSLLALNAALSAVTYLSDPDYNSGTPVPVPDEIRITIDDLGNTDQWGAASLRGEGIILVTVAPTQDDPRVVVDPGFDQIALDEDTPRVLPGISIADVDAQYDADWIGQVILSVDHGTLSLPPEFRTRELFDTQRLNFRVSEIRGTTADGTSAVAADVNVAGELRDVGHLFDDSGLSLSVSGKLVHLSDEASGANSWSISSRTGGLLIDFGDQRVIDAMQIWNFNVAGQLAFGAEWLDVFVWDDLPDGALDDAGRRVNASPLAVASGTGLAGYEGQTFLFGGFADRPAELGGAVTNVPQSVVGRYVFLKLADDNTGPAEYHVGLSEVKFYGGPAIAAGRISQVAGTDGAAGTVLAPEVGSAGDPRTANRVFDGSGLAYNAFGHLVHGTGEALGAVSWSVAQNDAGLLIDLGAVYTIDVMQIWNFNTVNAAGDDLTGYGATSFDLWVSTDSLATMAPVRTAVPLPLAPFNAPDYLGETYLFSGRLPASIPAELGDASGTIDDVADTLVEGRYLFIKMNSSSPSGHLGLSEVRLYGRPQGAPDLVYIDGDGWGGDRELHIQGSFDDLNAALANLTYTPDPDYNNVKLAAPDVLNIRVIDADSVAVPPGGGLGSGSNPGFSPGPLRIDQVTTSANQLRDFLLGPGVIPIGNATRVGGPLSSGLFSGGSTSIGIPAGIILSSGNVNFAAGPNTSDSSTGTASGAGDADLNAEFGVTSRDTTYLQFDFQLVASGPQDLFFDFVFASEEYNEWANSSFNDVFAFFLDGVNIAFIPGTTTPISINTINGGRPLGVNPQNPEFYNNNDPFEGGLFLNDFGMDGFTTVFTATALGIGPGVHTIKLAISDVGDTSLDSGVFLAAGSFSNVRGRGTGKHSSDWQNTPSNAATDNSTIPQVWKSAVTLTVNPTQDPPQIVARPSDATILEDAPPLTLPFTVFDIDARSELIVGPDTLIYDPNWEGEVTVSVEHGTLSLPVASLPSLTFPDDIDGDGTIDDINGDGVVDANDVLLGSFRTLIFRGLLDDLNAALAGLRYHVDPEYNSGHPSGVVTPDVLRLRINDLGNTGVPGAPLGVETAVTITVSPVQDRPTIAVPAALARVVDEDADSGLLLVDAGGSGIRVDDLDDAHQPGGIDLQVRLWVQRGGLVMDRTNLLTVFDTWSGADGIAPARDAVETTYQQIIVQGKIADLNAALQTLTYYGDQDFNIGSVNEILRIEVNDLGNTDASSPLPLTALAQVTLSVRPVNDPPTITIPSLLPGFVTESTTTGLLLQAPFFDTPRWITVADIDDLHDPTAIQLQMTLHVSHGGLTLNTTTGLSFDVNGDGIDDRVPAISAGDTQAPVVAGTYQTLRFRGTIGALNAALATLRYFGDWYFTGSDVLEMQVDDLGNTGGGRLTGTAEHTIFVGGTNDPPTMVLPTTQTVNENSLLVFSAANVPSNAITVNDPDVLETAGGQLLVTLTVASGMLTLPDVTGLTFPLDIDGDGLSDDTDGNGQIDDVEVAGFGFRQITVSGTPADLNAALDGLIYQGLSSFNGTDRLVVVVNDQGNTGSGPVNEIRGTVTITVAAVNDPPTVLVPGQQTGWEDTDLPIPGIVVGDAADEAYGNVILEVTLQAVNGTLRVRTDVPGGVVTVSGNNTNNVVLIGQPARINATLANLTGLIYRGNPNFNDYSLDGNPNLNEQIVVTVNDRGNVGAGGALQTKGTIPVSVRQVNDPPSIMGPTQRTIAEDTTTVIPLTIQDVDANESPANPLRPVTVTLTLTDTAGQPLGTVGTLTVKTDVPGGIVHGVSGLIENNGTAAVTVSGSPASVTATLANVNGLRYTPPANYNGRLALVAVVTDHGNSGATVPNSSLTAAVTIIIQVDAVNDPPVAVNDTYATPEDTRLIVSAPGVLGNDYDVEGSPLVPRVITSTAHGTLAFNANGSFTYIPGANFHGTDSFTYRVNDGVLDSNLATVTLVVEPVNNAPVAVNDSYLALEDWPVNVPAPGLLANDIDVDGDLLVPTVVTGPVLGLVQLFADGSFTYTPHANAHGFDTFTYRVNDGELNSNVATVTITILPINDQPIASDNSYSTVEDTPLSISAPGVLGNDVDVDGDPLTAQLVSGPANGTLVLNSNGSFTYTPDLDYFGSDSFTYRAHDGQAGSVPATVTITVTAVNDPPVAWGDSYSIVEDTVLVVAAPGVLANDTDVENSSLTANLVSLPTHGTLVLNANGSFTYTPGANYHGPDSFTYRARDGQLNSTNIATVAITVTPVNDVPVAIDDSYITAEDQVLTVAAPGILGNDTDVDGDPLTVQLESAPAFGLLALNANGSFMYTPNPDFYGADWFTYRARDAVSGSNVATVTITVTPVNDAPVAVNASYALDEDTVLVITAPGLLADAGDVDGDALTAHGVNGPAHGVLSINWDGSFSYTPVANYHGPDSFTYRASDGQADSNVATVAITVSPVNDLPAVADDNYTINEDTLLTVAAPGVLGNDTDVDGDPLTVSLVASPAHGTLTLNANGSFTYLPNQDYHGPDGFTYRLHDGTAYSAAATVTITVVQVNDPPRAENDAYATSEDTVLTIAAPGVKANDVDPDGDAFSVRLIDSPAHGTLVLAADGSFVYTPAADFHGTDRFTYRANDLLADSNLATVTITVAAVNDPPVALDDAYAGLQDTPLVVIAPGILGNDSDVDGDLVTAVFVALPAHGILTLNANGSFTYIPDANFIGADQFTYQAHDGTVASNVATVTITVTSTNEPPVAVNDSYTTEEDTLLTVLVPGVLANDTDADGNPLTAALVSPPSAGILTLNGNGSFTYLPGADFHGTDTFTYRVRDGLADSNVATVTLTVTPVNDPPMAIADSYVTAEDTTLTVNVAGGVLSNDTDVDGDPLLVTLVTTVSHGTLVLNPNGSFSYTPAGDYYGTDTFTYKARDAVADSNVATVTITVTPVNDPPLAVSDSYATGEGVAVVIGAPGVLGNDLEVEGDPLTARVVTPPSAGTLILNGDGSFVYTPWAYYNGTDTFTYRVHDGELDSNVATVTIAVAAVNDPPILADVEGTTNEDQPMTFLASQLLGSARPGPTAPGGTADDEQSQTLTVIGVTPFSAAGGTVTFDVTTGLITYTPPRDFFGIDVMTYRVTDDGLPAPAEATGTLVITVLSVDDPPRAVNDAYFVYENAVLNVTAPGVLANDYHPDGKSLTLQPQQVVSSQGVTVQIAADGRFGYDPTGKTIFRSLNDGQTALDTFTYQIADSEGRTARGTVTITIHGISDPPYHNPAAAQDVNGDDLVTPLDVLLVINVINAHGSGAIPAGMPASLYIDVDGDGLLTPGDALSVVNALNAASVGGEHAEGESILIAGLTLDAGPVLASAGMAAMPIAGTSAQPAGDESGNAVVIREIVAPERGSRADDTARVLRDAAADWAVTAFDSLDANYPAIDKALEDLLDTVGSTAESEAATDVLFGQLFG